MSSFTYSSASISVGTSVIGSFTVTADCKYVEDVDYGYCQPDFEIIDDSGAVILAGCFNQDSPTVGTTYRLSSTIDYGSSGISPNGHYSLRMKNSGYNTQESSVDNQSSTDQSSSGQGSSDQGNSDQSGTTQTLTLSEHTATIPEGSIYTLSVTYSGSDDIIWTSSDESVAVVSSTGQITTLEAGTAIITAKAGNVSDTCTLTVVVDTGSGDSSENGGSGNSGGSGESGNNGGSGDSGGSSETPTGAATLAEYVAANGGVINGEAYTRSGNTVTSKIEYDAASNKLTFTADHTNGSKVWFEYDVSTGTAVSNTIYMTVLTSAGTYGAYATYNISSYTDYKSLSFTVDGIGSDEDFDMFCSSYVGLATRAWLSLVRQTVNLTPAEIGYTSFVES